MSIVRIDPGGGRNAEHIAIIVVVDLLPSNAIFAQAALVPPPLLTTATGPSTLSRAIPQG